MHTPPPVGSGLTFQFSCQSVQLGVQCTHLGAFLSGGHWNIGDVYIHTSGLVPSMQLRRAAYHVFQSRRDVDHFIAVAFCKANAGFPSRVLRCAKARRTLGHYPPGEGVRIA
jgi:hypothetical protein